jgi:hypothetical protein
VLAYCPPRPCQTSGHELLIAVDQASTAPLAWSKACQSQRVTALDMPIAVPTPPSRAHLSHVSNHLWIGSANPIPPPQTHLLTSTVVAPASSAFSTSSLTAVARSTTTCGWCTRGVDGMAGCGSLCIGGVFVCWVGLPRLGYHHQDASTLRKP